MVAEARHDFYLRIPLIEGVNADEENITRSAAFLASLPWEHRIVNLLPYHDIGKSKTREVRYGLQSGSICFRRPFGRDTRTLPGDIRLLRDRNDDRGIIEGLLFPLSLYH